MHIVHVNTLRATHLNITHALVIAADDDSNVDYSID